MWGDGWDWSQRGEEWSTAWGSVSHQWWTTLFPRIQGYVPAGRILEIAPGFGRWTHYLRDLCDDLVAVDIAQNAVEACQARFADDSRVTTWLGDGTSLPMVTEDSVDFVFSFDSLVHAERDVMFRYVEELARILTADGVAFLHHSNLGSHPQGSYDPAGVHWRAPSVSAALVAQASEALGLRCISQEKVAWGGAPLLLDCFSVITRQGSRWDRENIIVDNHDFGTSETAIAHRLSTQYPPSREDVRFGDRSGPITGARIANGIALRLLAQGEIDSARATLHEHVCTVIDADTLNDLAVLTLHAGDADAAKDLLRAVLRLHPGDEDAAENLRRLEASDQAPQAADPAPVAVA